MDWFTLIYIAASFVAGLIIGIFLALRHQVKDNNDAYTRGWADGYMQRGNDELPNM